MELIIVQDSFDLDVFKMHADQRSLGALDIETTIEPNPWIRLPQLVSVAMTFDGYYAFVFRDDRYLRQAWRHVTKVGWLMHNGLFDKLMLSLFGIEVVLAHDTMAMQYLLDPDLPKDLESLSQKYLGAKPYKDVDYQNILLEPFEKVAQMNGQDACNTYNLFRPLADQLNARIALSRVYQWILMPALPALIQTTLNGVPVDQGHFQELLAEYEPEVARLRQELEDATPAPDPDSYPKGWPKPTGWRVNDKVVDGVVVEKGQGKWAGQVFNPGSPTQVAHVLFDQWRLPVLELTDTDKPSTKADVLLRLETEWASGEQEQWLATLRSYRERNKVLTSYLQSWPALWDQQGWLHPRYKPLHVVTGRLSSDQPNIQNVPRDKRFRNLFGGVKGMTWIKADYSQIELRIAAWLAQETLMLDAYRKGKDLHMLTARLILGEETASARQVGKTLNFGLLYGAGPKTLRRIARTEYEVFLSEEEARKYYAEFFRTYPGLKMWQRISEAKLTQTGVVQSPLGRVRYLPDAKIPWEVEAMRTHKIQAIHEGLNHPVQSFASDLLLHSLTKVYKPVQERWSARVVAEVHDEIDVLCPTESAQECAAYLKETMEDVSWTQRFGIEVGVPVVASVEMGSHWGNLEEVTP